MRFSPKKQKKIFSLDAARDLASEQLPKLIFDYADGGAGKENTIYKNETDFDRYELVPRPLNGAGERDLSINIFGQRLSIPIINGPVGLLGLFWPNGEIEVAKAAEAKGTGFCLSHGSVCTMEELAAVGNAPRWMQIFVYKDRAITRRFCERAHLAGFDALVLTIDNQITGKRERDLENGFTIPPDFKILTYFQMLSKYKWLWRMRGSLRRITFGNYASFVDAHSISELASKMNNLLDPYMNWDDIAWLREIWKKPLIIKGILHPEDAQKAVDLGVDGIVVSNHGGRQLDTVISSINAIPQVVDQVEGKVTVLFDGGIRRGTDVIKALALGANACLIGRPQVWGAAIGGRAGVEHMLDILSYEIDMAMGLCGVKAISEISKDLVFERID